MSQRLRDEILAISRMTKEDRGTYALENGWDIRFNKNEIEIIKDYMLALGERDEAKAKLDCSNRYFLRNLKETRYYQGMDLTRPQSIPRVGYLVQMGINDIKQRLSIFNEENSKLSRKNDKLGRKNEKMKQKIASLQLKVRLLSDPTPKALCTKAPYRSNGKKP